MKGNIYSVVAGRNKSKLVKFMHCGFPFMFGLCCIALFILVWVSVLTM